MKLREYAEKNQDLILEYLFDNGYMIPNLSIDKLMEYVKKDPILELMAITDGVNFQGE